MRNKADPMTRDEATRMLRDVWGELTTISRWQLDRIATARLAYETALETCSRVAEIDVSDISPFDTDRIRSRVSNVMTRRETVKWS